MIPKTIFNRRKPGNGWEKRRKNMGAHTFKEASSKLASGKKLMTTHFI
jgi:hypothetical protein